MKPTLITSFLLCLILLQMACIKDNFFREPPDYPVIDSLSPARGFKGTQIRLWGSGFSTYTSRNIVHINGVLLRIDSPSTSTVLLATIIDSTGTGPVELTLNNREVKGPIFTYLGRSASMEAPEITGAYFNVNRQPNYFSIIVKKIPATNNGIRVMEKGVNIPIKTVLRPGDNNYDPNIGIEIILADQDLVFTNAEGIFAKLMVTYDGVPSNTFALQLYPEILNIFSAQGNYRFAAGDTLTLSGNYFGDRTLLNSSIVISYQGITLKSPDILSWTNKQIKAIMPKYPEVPEGLGNKIKLDIKVGDKINRENFELIYLAGQAIPPTEEYSKIQYSGTTPLSEPRKYLAAAGNNNTIIFGGGIGVNGYSSTVDIYNVLNNTWSTSYLSEARYNLAAAAAGNKIVFAGGYGTAGYSKTVDIYDTETGKWTVAKLSEARTNLTAAGTGTKIIFAGGETNRGTSGSSAVVDIYDVSTGVWTTAQLAEPRSQLAAAAVGDKILVAGGHNSTTGADSKTVDIFDVRTNKWTASLLSMARYLFSGSGAGNKILFAGGRTSNTGTASNRVDNYDVLNNTWSLDNLSQKGDGTSSSARSNKIVFGSGSTYDIYDVAEKSWTSGKWSEDKFQPAAAGAGNKILFGGGETRTGNGYSSIVEIFTLSK